jgi:predicted nucleotidyltransferase component of viral defense system
MDELRTRDLIAAEYRIARAERDGAAMARCRNEETCLVLLGVLERLAADPDSFAHRVALKGGILMAGELLSPRVSSDIDTTSGMMKRIDPGRITVDICRAGGQYGLQPSDEPRRTPGGAIIPFCFDSLTGAGDAKIEVSVREDLVFPVRDALLCPSGLGIPAFSLPAVAKAELVAEKIRALVQRAQPRDLFDLRYYLVESGWHLDPHDLRTAVDAKLAITRTRKWRDELWRRHLAEIEPLYEATLLEWVRPERLPAFEDAVADVARRLRALRLG